MAYFMGIDVGTQGSRAVVIDEDGVVTVSERPGLGVELNEDVVNEHLVREDG